jgi:hypothetical protein
MLLAPAGVVRREFLLYELTDCLTKHSQIVIHPGRLKSHHRYCKATGKCGPASSKPDVLEKLSDRAA